MIRRKGTAVIGIVHFIPCGMSLPGFEPGTPAFLRRIDENDALTSAYLIRAVL